MLIMGQQARWARQPKQNVNGCRNNDNVMTRPSQSFSDLTHWAKDKLIHYCLSQCRKTTKQPATVTRKHGPICGTTLKSKRKSRPLLNLKLPFRESLKKNTVNKLY
ncbi:hypothetical protein PoB_001686300 [Plakobranchus ocellatus]|uniref:Uncharacterized protein n=1 Tax=Plakobranchus ocellatus TaxID=259542 RepID=A0AAV3Z6Y0_9GAST|nr:hypothetical protein PoB_001686300 [Plakobranchus ocellatus]